MDWRKNIRRELRPYVERLIAESFMHKEAYGKAEDKGKAQLWLALGILQKQVQDLNLKIDYIEKALQGVGRKDQKTNMDQVRREKEEVERIFRDIIGGKFAPKKPVSTIFERPKSKAKKKK